jgi:hypothetical protein
VKASAIKIRLARKLAIAAAVVVCAAFIALLAVGLARPSQAESAENAFRTCVAGVPHPSRPLLFLSSGPAAHARAIAMLQFQASCARTSGMDMDTEPPVLSFVRKILRRESYADGRVGFYRRRMAQMPKSLDMLERLEYLRYSSISSGGLRLQQITLATGYTARVFGIRARKPNRRLEERIRKGTWWTDVCGG